jgi:hypothetical protein
MIHAVVSWVFAKILKDGPMKDRLWWAFDEDRTTSNVTIKFLIPRGMTPGAESDVHVRVGQVVSMNVHECVSLQPTLLYQIPT